MLIPVAHLEARCDFCKDRDAALRFGEYGMLICDECLTDIQDIGVRK